jgi:DNA-binding transcriptional LysR family regulator
VDIRQLKYFLAVVEEGQFVKASRRLNITQPPLSQQIQLLEQELGVQLLARGKHNIRLTEAGRVLHERAEQLVALMKLTKDEVQETASGSRGQISVGTIPSAGLNMLNLIQNYNNCYPNISFQLWHRGTFGILELLDTGIIDFGIVRFPIDHNTYEFVTFPEHQMMAVSTSAWFNDNTNVIKLADLRSKPLMSHRRDEPTIRDYCRKVGYEPIFSCISDDIMPLLHWANYGLGIAVIPNCAYNYIQTSNLLFKNITDPSIVLTNAAVWKKARSLSSASIRFITLSRQHISQMK